MAKLPANKGKNTQNPYRTINGKTVWPCRYYGSQVGHGNYMAGTLDNELVRDSKGRPFPYSQIASDKKVNV